MTFTMLESFNLAFAGLLAGAELVVCLGVRVPLRNLEQQPQILMRQDLIQRLRLLVPALMAPTVISAAALAVMESERPGFVLRCVGLAAMAVWLATTFLGTVPINKAAMDWRPDAPPDNWRRTVRIWEWLDVVRCLAAVAALGCFAAAGLT